MSYAITSGCSWASRAATIALVICLLTSSTPAAPQTIVAVAKESSTSFIFWFHANGLAELIQGRGIGNARGQEKQSDRDAKVTRVQIFPGEATIDLSDRVRFSAVAYDRDDNPVGGVKIRWSGQGAIPQARVRISPHGEFEAMTPGSFTITAQAGAKTAQVTVTVRAGLKRDLHQTPLGTRQVSSRDLPGAKIGSAKERKDSKSSATLSFKPRNRQGGSTASARRAHAVATMPEPLPQGGGGGWDDSNYWSAGRPENRVGNPSGATVDGGSGSGNFQFVAPVYSAAGRRINISLDLAYNSRLWNKANSQISYDNDRGWPAPGFNLGFGKLLGMGVYNGGMLVDADGTRHSYSGSLTIYSWGTYFVGHTTDGSLIDYNYSSGTGGGIVYALARLPNGTVITYGAAGPGAVYPTSIEDANGNLLSITYVNNSGPRIQTVTDTLGRTISFSYDPNNLLTAVTTPGLSGGTRTLLRLHYHQLALNYGFSGLTPSVRDSYPWVVDAIYYPATSTGYWLNDSDSYSSYGMLAKVVEERGMGFSASSLNDMGNVSQGSITRAETYNYPLSPDYGLTDAPTYTSMTESWTRDGVNFDSATTGYEVHENDTPRSTIITLPNGTKSKQLAFNAPGQYNDGVVYHDETYVTEGQPLQSSNSFWEQGAYNSPRPTRVERTDERGQTTAAEFSYGSVYNQIAEMREYDYGGTTLLRATRSQYQNNVNYTGTAYSNGYFGRHIFNLPLSVEVYAADYSTRVSRTEYQYDGQPLSAAPNVVQHDQAFNPHAADEGFCNWEPDWSDGDCNGSCMPNCPECIQDPSCDGYCPQIWMCPYDGSTDYRGNVTQVTSYADAINLTGADTETRGYDVTGNMVTTSTNCCQQISLSYTIDTQYAYPLSKTRGSATDPYAQVTTSMTVDFNTGLRQTSTDANGRQSSVSYDSTTLRPTTSTSPTGAHTDYGYDDAAMAVSSTTYPTAGTTGPIANQSVKYLNGLGQVRIEQALGAGNVWDYVATVYDNMGRMSQQTRPYRSGETQQWTTTTYDALSRVISVAAPDGSTTQTFYNEASRPTAASSAAGETRRIQDAWGRERWGRTDAGGKLVEVVEPDSAGGGSVASNGMVTTYAYDTLGNLTQVNQGSQTRSFKYDALGRLTAQKLAEVDATLNDAGTYVGSGTWSDVFTYDNRSNLTSRTDARGVKTVFSYNSDPLNRLQSVSWDTSGFGDTSNPILPAATVSYTYRAKSSPTDLKDTTQLSSVSASGVSTESYSYDVEGLVSSKTLTLNSRSSYPFVTDYIYDTLDRVSDVRYPAEYGNGSAPRKVAHHDYDIASRLSGLTFDGQSFASNIVYNAASQTTSLNIGAGTNQVNENYTYNTQTGLLDNQTVTRGGNTLLNLSYDYTNANGKRTGQLTKIGNNLDHNKDRGYEYDALGRLQRATGGQNVNWVQRYHYDRYGNRTDIFSYTADQYVRNFYQSALNRQPNSSELQAWLSNLQTAYSQGLSQYRATMQSLGETLFSSQEYANRNRSDHDYVYDLYHAYLLRDPDPSGWAFWESQVPINGRAAVRNGFNWCEEFWLKLNGTSPYSPAVAVPADGLTWMGIDASSNRLNGSGFAYDAAGNQTRALIAGGGASQRFQYDAANRLVKVKADDNTTVLATYTYGDSNGRLIAEEGATRIYYTGGGTPIAEYTESGSSTIPVWSKSYVYLGERLLSTLTPNGSGGEAIEYDHPDRLGTRLVTNPSTGTSFEQVTLPFGTVLNADSTGGTNKRFTSYDRSATTGLDYAVNRHYDSQQGRFTQVDPAGMSTTSLSNPQTLNLYTYCTNDPVNHADPSGLGFFSFLKKIFNFLKKAVKWFIVALTIAIAVVAIVFFPIIAVFTSHLTALLGTIGLVADAASSLLGALGLNKAAGIFGIISAGMGLLSSLVDLDKLLKSATRIANEVKKAVLKVISQGATLASQILSATGHSLAGQWFSLASTVTGFISDGYKKAKQYKWHPEKWEIFDFARSAAEQIATLTGATKLADILDVAGLVSDIRDYIQEYKDSRNLPQPPDEAEWNGNPHYQLTDRDKLHWFIYTLLDSAKTSANTWSSILGRIEKGVALARP